MKGGEEGTTTTAAVVASIFLSGPFTPGFSLLICPEDAGFGGSDPLLFDAGLLSMTV